MDDFKGMVRLQGLTSHRLVDQVSPLTLQELVLIKQNLLVVLEFQKVSGFNVQCVIIA